MKKILLVLNHSLAGFGSDEQAQLKPILFGKRGRGSKEIYWLCKKVSCRCGTLRTCHALS